MPEFKIPNMDDVPSAFQPLDDTVKYRTRVGDAALGHTGPQSKNPGEPMIEVQLEVTQPPEWEGKSMYENLMLPGLVKPTDTVAERRRKLERGIRLKQFMEAFQLSWGPGGTFKTEDWVGAEADCDISNEEYMGQVRSRPKKYYKIS